MDVQAEETLVCGYCFRPSAKTKLKRCGGCKRRAYCSRDCQKADWNSTQTGQGHKEWCRLSCGEEGIDWEVKFVSETKGLGIIAKREFEPLERIMVERMFPEQDFQSRFKELTPFKQQEIENLMPKNGNLFSKFYLNFLGSENDPSGLCIRMSRVNHSCQPNAYHFYIPNLKVKVLLCETRILKGEEVTISYVDYMMSGRPFTFNSIILKEKYGIVCPPDCACKTTSFRELMERIRELDSAILRLGQLGKIKEALRFAKQFLDLQEEHKLDAVLTIRTCYDFFQLAIANSKTLAEGVKKLKDAANIALRLFGPSSDLYIKYSSLAKNPSSHQNYLSMEF